MTELPKELTDKWTEAAETGEHVSIGDIVVCDICAGNFTESNEQGGMIFGSKAYCPSCTVDALPRIRHYEEESYIRAQCPDGVAFADFVRDYRGPNAGIQILS